MPSSPAAMGGDAPRGGVRGGRDQFNWEEIKTDKFRECYLGASVKASVGRWQKNRDVLWYTRDGGPGGAQAAADELASVKAEEERLMQEALGLRPVTQRRGVSGLDNGELQHLLKRGAGVDGTEEGAAGGDDLRVKGVGYTPAVAEHQKAQAQQVKAGEVFDGREVLAGVTQAAVQEGHVGGAGHLGLRDAPRGPRADSDSESDEHRRKRREAKHARKEAKRVAKEARREHRRRSRSRSRSPDERRHRSRSPEQRRRRSRSREHRRH